MTDVTQPMRARERGAPSIVDHRRSNAARNVKTKWSMSPTIREYMTPSPHTVEADQPLTVAHQLMRAHDIRHLPVMERGELVGIVTSRDLHVLEGFKEVDRLTTPVRIAMTRFPFTVAADAPLEDVAHEMATHKHGSAIVVESGHVLGIFTTVDALRALAESLHHAPTSTRWGHVISG